jgi:hypothetical protein
MNCVVITWDEYVVPYFKILRIPALERLNESKNKLWDRIFPGLDSNPVPRRSPDRFYACLPQECSWDHFAGGVRGTRRQNDVTRGKRHYYRSGLRFLLRRQQ